MDEGLFEDVGVFDFDELANHLLEQGQDVSPSALHGCLTGLLCGGAGTEAEIGLDALAQSMDLVVHGELAELMLQLYGVTAAALEDETFSFHPLLPDDEVEIDERTEALASWAQGFLTGYAHISAKMGKDAALSEDSSEVLRDIGAMAEASVSDEDTGDEAEGSYMELVEYLRFGVLNIFMDCYVGESGNAPQDPQQLH